MNKNELANLDSAIDNLQRLRGLVKDRKVTPEIMSDFSIQIHRELNRAGVVDDKSLRERLDNMTLSELDDLGIELTQ